jgi:hypothetical protein
LIERAGKSNLSYRERKISGKREYVKMLSRMSERRDTCGEKIMCEMETPKKISWRTRKKEEKKRAKMRMKGAMREHDGARNEEWR